MDNFNGREYLKKMLNDKQKHIQIIAMFCLEKNFTIENKEQIQYLISRYSVEAKKLSCFPIEKIKATLQWLLETANYKVELETIGKFIFETPEKLEKKKPIITLTNGEEIYDATKLSGLEQSGKIKYNNKDKKWYEVI